MSIGPINWGFAALELATLTTDIFPSLGFFGHCVSQDVSSLFNEGPLVTVVRCRVSGGAHSLHMSSPVSYNEFCPAS